MSIYDDIKREKLEYLLEWLQQQAATLEITKFTQRVEQQIAFLNLKGESDAIVC